MVACPLTRLFVVSALVCCFLGAAPIHAAKFAWQADYAKVMPTGELVYSPQPFQFEVGDSQRFIDFERGDDAAEGSREAPWKHHPWDPAAMGKSRAAASEVHTFIFKGGVQYRGRFIIPEGAGGTAAQPFRLTRDPSWGEGAAVINGAEVVGDWTHQAHAKMPDAGKVWMAEVDFLPRNLWMVEGTKAPVRLQLARWPNWKESDPNDLMSEWPTWDQPEWWKDKNVTKVENVSKHVGIAKSLPRPLEDLVGGTVWSEWGIVMGSPYPAQIEGVDQEKDGIAFRGPWTYEALEKIITGNRYYLENLPQFLDEAGEFWVERMGESSARIFLRLPGDRDPNTVTIEAARHTNFFEGKRVGHIHWSGLTFRFGNVGWDYNHPRWARPDLQVGAINLEGAAEEIVIANNTFEHVPMPVRIRVGDAQSRVDAVCVRDNVMTDTDQGAVFISNFNAHDAPRMGHLGHVDFLRNRLERIGMRILSGEHGHAVDLQFPETSHLAGNFLHRIAGWGLSVFGGKPSGESQIGLEAPLSRHLIHHNRVEDVLLKSNDWGGIETWQGGSFYVFNNIVINAIGYKNWLHAKDDNQKASSFGHSYYLDGSFKNYLFNNIGRGRNNDVTTKSVNLTAIQNIFSFENWFFHNSFHRFVVATRQQAPEAGRFRYLGNAFSDVTEMLYRHAEPIDGEPDPNASHYTQGGTFDYKTLAYNKNVIHGLAGSVGVFEETGVVYKKPGPFSEALQRLRAQAGQSVKPIVGSPFQNPDAMDWRPTDSLSGERGARIFVPWGLARTVGEWQFTRNNANPNEIIDEHWFMGAGYGDRSKYKDTPRYPLLGRELVSDSYLAGGMEDWTEGVLRLDGKTQWLRVPNDTLKPEARTVSAEKTSLLVEASFRTVDASGVLVQKLGDGAGYSLRLRDGKVSFVVSDGVGRLEVASEQKLSDDQWHHLIAEFDRPARSVRLYLNGKLVASQSGSELASSLANTSDFVVGGLENGGADDQLAVDLDFLRISLSSFAESKTTIEELHAWQFHGPQQRDFAGQARDAKNLPGALTAPSSR